MTDGAGPPPAGAPWTAEVDVTPQLAAELIRGQFPELPASQVSLLETGWDNTAFLVDGQWLFRFPRREIALPGVRREIAVLPRLAAVLPLPIPDPRFTGRPTPRYPWPFFGARLLPGTEYADAALPEDRRVRTAAAVGGFLRVLHDPGLVTLVDGDGLPVDPMRRATPGIRAVRAREVVERLSQQGIWSPGREVSGLLEEAARAPAGAGGGPAGGPFVVCHGDLHLRHLLVDGDGAATGVIDWGDLCLGDPAVDLMIAYLAFEGEARAALLAAYGGPVGAERELAARTCAVSVGVALLEYAADEGRAALARESIAGLRRAVSA
ncbi:MAG: phosphotransferase [Gemmatimonadota bacterium]